MIERESVKLTTLGLMEWIGIRGWTDPGANGDEGEVQVTPWWNYDASGTPVGIPDAGTGIAHLDPAANGHLVWSTSGANRRNFPNAARNALGTRFNSKT